MMLSMPSPAMQLVSFNMMEGSELNACQGGGGVAASYLDYSLSILLRATVSISNDAFVYHIYFWFIISILLVSPI